MVRPPFTHLAVTWLAASALTGASDGPLCTAVSAGGTSEVALDTLIDRWPPDISGPFTISPATASPNATDALSGVASQSCEPVVTSSIGTKSVSCTATDSAKNTSTKSVTYTVV